MTGDDGELGRSQQRFLKDRPVLGLSAPGMPGSPLLERIDDALIQIPNSQIRHLAPPP